MTVVAPVAVTLPERPYPGLRAFEKEEWAIFFGRERMIDGVIGRLAESRLVLIHGASGSGKSSLVKAGVLPKLALQYGRHGAPWLTCEMRPSGGPLWNLACAFAGLQRRETDLEYVSAVAGQFNARETSLASVAASLKGVAGKSLCLLIDQFEELFRYEKETSRDEAELFVDLVRRAAAGEGSETAPDGFDLHVIVTMRSEFLGECARFAGFAETINRTQYLVPRMDDDGLMRAMRRPAEMYGADLDPSLAERLIAPVRGREDELPLLQHGLMLMWEDAKRRAKPGELMKLDGSLVKEAGGLAGLLSGHADRVMEQVAPDEPGEALVEDVFRALTDVNSEGSAIRRPLPFRELCAVTGAAPEALRPILDAFRAPGVSFLTPYPPKAIEDKTPIDISHEALIRCWRRIDDKKTEQGWLRQELRDGLAWRLLLFEAGNFARDPKVTVSQAMVEAFERRLGRRNAAWAKRYGGGWAEVKALVEASREHWRREAEKEEANRQKEIDNERLRAEAAEQRELAARKTALWEKERALAADKTALLEKERARRSRLVAFAAFAGALMALGLAAYASRDRLRKEFYRLASARALSTAQERALKAGETFKECADCPEMVVAPAGRFMMGSPAGQGLASEYPQHPVTIPRPFAIARFEVTFDNWDACVKYGDCDPRVGDSGWGRGRRPVINVSWADAQTYVKWLSRLTGRDYRLLSEAEYEYAARAGKETRYPWGDDIRLDGRPMANCDGCGSQWDNKQTAPVGSFPANAFSLYDMVGNVLAWTEDCWHETYKEAPSNGSPWTTGDCSRRVVRGGSWYYSPVFLRSAYRIRAGTDIRSGRLGFRVARTLTP